MNKQEQNISQITLSDLTHDAGEIQIALKAAQTSLASIGRLEDMPDIPRAQIGQALNIDDIFHSLNSLEDAKTALDEQLTHINLKKEQVDQSLNDGESRVKDLEADLISASGLLETISEHAGALEKENSFAAKKGRQEIEALKTRKAHLDRYLSRITTDKKNNVQIYFNEKGRRVSPIFVAEKQAQKNKIDSDIERIITRLERKSIKLEQKSFDIQNQLLTQNQIKAEIASIYAENERLKSEMGSLDLKADSLKIHVSKISDAEKSLTSFSVLVKRFKADLFRVSKAANLARKNAGPLENSEINDQITGLEEIDRKIQSHEADADELSLKGDTLKAAHHEFKSLWSETSANVSDFKTRLSQLENEADAAFNLSETKKACKNLEALGITLEAKVKNASDTKTDISQRFSNHIDQINLFEKNGHALKNQKHAVLEKIIKSIEIAEKTAQKEINDLEDQETQASELESSLESGISFNRIVSRRLAFIKTCIKKLRVQKELNIRPLNDFATRHKALLKRAKKQSGSLGGPVNQILENLNSLPDLEISLNSFNEKRVGLERHIANLISNQALILAHGKVADTVDRLNIEASDAATLIEKTETALEKVSAQRDNLLETANALKAELFPLKEHVEKVLYPLNLGLMTGLTNERVKSEINAEAAQKSNAELKFTITGLEDEIFQLNKSLEDQDLAQNSLEQKNSLLEAHSADLKKLVGFFQVLWAKAAREQARLATANLDLNSELISKQVSFDELSEELHEKLIESGARLKKSLEESWGIKLELTAVEETNAQNREKIIKTNQNLKAAREKITALKTNLSKQQAMIKAFRQEKLELGQKLEQAENLFNLIWTVFKQTSLDHEAELEIKETQDSENRELIAELSRNLKQKQAGIKTIEAKNLNLAMLLWGTMRFGPANEEALSLLVKLTNDKGFKDAAEITVKRLYELSQGLVTYVKSEELAKLAGNSFKRGLYALLISSGIILSIPEESSKASILPGNLAAIELRRSESAPGSSFNNVLNGPVYSTRAQRTFKIDHYPLLLRAKGFDHIQQKINQDIANLALSLDLTDDETMRLLQKRYTSGDVILINKLMTAKGAVTLLKSHLPQLTEDARQYGLSPALISPLFKMAAKSENDELAFWDRLYADYRAVSGDPEESMNMVLSNFRLHQSREKQRNKVEFSGLTRPIPKVEKWSRDQFLEYIVPYITLNLKAFLAQRGRELPRSTDNIETYAHKLAVDMYAAAKSFQVPLTIMVIIAHQESYFANILGDNALSASPFQLYTPTRPLIRRTMNRDGFQIPKGKVQLENHISLATYMAAFHISHLIEIRTIKSGKNQKLICNMDRVALAYNGGVKYPRRVYGKKLNLLKYLKKMERDS